MAQNNPPKELRFNHLFVEDGLHEGQIRVLIRDKEGYIWAGTLKEIIDINSVVINLLV